MRWIAVAAVALSCVAQVWSACPGQKLLPISRNPAERGPWPVGERTVTLTSRNLTVEIWYPAVVGSEAGRKPVEYSVRDEWLPPRQARKIPDSENPIQYIEAFDSLPLDSTHGPYPVHVHVHGTAAWRTASAHQMTHYASRGFIVLSADHPGINLYDMLSLNFGGVDQEGDARLIIEEIKSLQDPELGFLKGHVDTTKIALSGHSAGGGAVGAMADVGNVVMPWCAWGVDPSSPFIQSSLVLGGVEDGIARYSGQQSGYESSPAPKRLVGIARAGHMVVTDICFIGKEHGGIVEIAKRNGIYLAYLFGPLGEDGCDEGQVKDELAWKIVNYASAAAQEEVFYCDSDMSSALANIQKEFLEVSEYKEQLK